MGRAPLPTTGYEEVERWSAVKQKVEAQGDFIARMERRMQVRAWVGGLNRWGLGREWCVVQERERSILQPDSDRRGEGE
jgi:hypothetical protein